MWATLSPAGVLYDDSLIDAANKWCMNNGSYYSPVQYPLGNAAATAIAIKAVVYELVW